MQRALKLDSLYRVIEQVQKSLKSLDQPMEKLYLFHFSLCLFPSLVLGITFFSVFCGLRYVIILVIYFYNFALYKFFWVIDAVVNILKTNIKLNRIWTMMTFLTYEIGLKGRVL